MKPMNWLLAVASSVVEANSPKALLLRPLDLLLELYNDAAFRLAEVMHLT